MDEAVVAEELVPIILVPNQAILIIYFHIIFLPIAVVVSLHADGYHQYQVHTPKFRHFLYLHK